jgi:hypothetical protein
MSSVASKPWLQRAAVWLTISSFLAGAGTILSSFSASADVSKTSIAAAVLSGLAAVVTTVRAVQEGKARAKVDAAEAEKRIADAGTSAQKVAALQVKTAQESADAKVKAAKELMDEQRRAAMDMADSQVKAAKELADVQLKAAQEKLDSNKQAEQLLRAAAEKRVAEAEAAAQSRMTELLRHHEVEMRNQAHQAQLQLEIKEKDIKLQTANIRLEEVGDAVRALRDQIMVLQNTANRAKQDQQAHVAALTSKEVRDVLEMAADSLAITADRMMRTCIGELNASNEIGAQAQAALALLSKM